MALCAFTSEGARLRGGYRSLSEPLNGQPSRPSPPPAGLRWVSWGRRLLSGIAASALVCGWLRQASGTWTGRA